MPNKALLIRAQWHTSRQIDPVSVLRSTKRFSSLHGRRMTSVVGAKSFHSVEVLLVGILSK
jgi:hypothetical protein